LFLVLMTMTSSDSAKSRTMIVASDLVTLVGFVVDWTGISWLYNLPITDDDEDWEDEALPVPPEPPLDAILWMIGEGKRDEMDELDKFLLRALCWVDNTMFLLPISTIGLISGDMPLLLLEHENLRT
jgi:hypothetical protein